MKSFKVISNTKANYVVINNELTECNVLGYRISRDKASGEYKLVYEVETHLGITFMPENTPFYATVESYKAGASLYGDYIASPLCAVNNVFKHSFDTDGDKVCVWAYLNGDAVLVDVYDMYEYIGFRYSSGNYLPEGSMKLDCYQSREEVFNYNPKEYVDMDGTKKVSPGHLSKLLLTDEQKKLVDELDSIFKKLNDADVQLIYDNDYDRMYAINGSDIEEHEWDCTPDGFVLYRPHDSHLVRNQYIWTTGGCTFNIRFKEDKQ